METQTFYTTVGSISFTLLGLWWVVVQSRDAWRTDPARRRMAYAVSLHFFGVNSAWIMTVEPLRVDDAASPPPPAAPARRVDEPRP